MEGIQTPGEKWESANVHMGKIIDHELRKFFFLSSPLWLELLIRSTWN